MGARSMPDAVFGSAERATCKGTTVLKTGRGLQADMSSNSCFASSAGSSVGEMTLLACPTSTAPSQLQTYAFIPEPPLAVLSHTYSRSACETRYVEALQSPPGQAKRTHWLPGAVPETLSSSENIAHLWVPKAAVQVIAEAEQPIGLYADPMVIEVLLEPDWLLAAATAAGEMDGTIAPEPQAQAYNMTELSY
jgi:hypothetical protein